MLKRVRLSVSNVVVLSLFLAVISAAPASAQAPPGGYAPADIRYGAQIYAAQCTPCHGVTGNQIGGVDFNSGQLRRAPTDQDLRTIVTTGIVGTAMPPFKFDASELAGIIAYIRTFRDFDASGITLGDPGRGKAWFEGAGGCANCHRVYGKGPRLAPDLSDIGAIRSADYLQRTLLDPAGALLPVNRSVHIVTRDGKVINGRRLNEDTYSVQLIDDTEHLVSLPKADLREFTVLTTTTMPSYKDKANAQEQADVIAYLLSLKGLR
jgi:putative heme-binding domain-containing protein